MKAKPFLLKGPSRFVIWCRMSDDDRKAHELAGNGYYQVERGNIRHFWQPDPKIVAKYRAQRFFGPNFGEISAIRIQEWLQQFGLSLIDYKAPTPRRRCKHCGSILKAKK